jgi:hypothetical protein
MFTMALTCVVIAQIGFNYSRIVNDSGLMSERYWNLGYQVQAFGGLSICLHNLLVRGTEE